MQESVMLAAKTPDESFIQCVCGEIRAQVDKTHLFKMEIRKDKMLTKGIEIGQ
jgi:hypothetical protein